MFITSLKICLLLALKDILKDILILFQDNPISMSSSSSSDKTSFLQVVDTNFRSFHYEWGLSLRRLNGI